MTFYNWVLRAKRIELLQFTESEEQSFQIIKNELTQKYNN